jgi:uncharacterized OB-fold protein
MMAICPRCGSEKIIPGVPLLDRYGDVGGFHTPAEVQVHGAPQAWVFKDTVAAKLLADVCGECGNVELRVDDFRELYAKYLKSLDR